MFDQYPITIQIYAAIFQNVANIQQTESNDHKTLAEVQLMHYIIFLHETELR